MIMMMMMMMMMIIIIIIIIIIVASQARSIKVYRKIFSLSPLYYV